MMKRTCASILLASSIMVGGCGDPSPQEYLKKYEVAKANGNVAEGIVYLKNHIAEFPSDPQGRLYLAEAYFIQNDFEGSLKELDKAEEAGVAPSNLIALRVLNNYYGQNYEQAIWTVENDLDETSSLGELTLLLNYLSHLFQGEFFYSIPETLTGDTKVIAEKYSELFTSESSQIEYPNFDEPSTAVREKKWLEALIATRNGDNKKAAEKLDEFLEMMPKVSLAKFQLVEALIKDENFERATLELQRIEKVAPQHVYASYLRSYILFQQGQFEVAFEKVEYAIQNGINVKTALFVAGVSAFQTEKYESAYRYLSKASSIMPQNKSINNFLARTKIKLGYIDEAYDDLLEMEIMGKADESLLSFAVTIMSEQGRLKNASSLASKLREKNPTADNLLRDAHLRLLTGDKLATSLLDDAIEKEPSLQESWMLMASTYLNAGEYEEAHKLAAKWSEVDESYGKTLDALAFQFEEEYAQAEQLYREAINSGPSNIGAHRLLIGLLIKTERFEDALASTKALIKTGDTSFSSLGYLVKLSSKKNVASEVIKFLTSIRNSDLDNERLNVALALAYLEQGNKEDTKKILSELSSEDSSVIQQLIADIYISLDEEKMAKGALKKVIEMQPSNEVARIKLISLYENEGEIQQAEELVQSGLLINPTSRRLLITMIGLKIKLGKSHEAKSLINSVSRNPSMTPTEISLLDKYQGEVALMNKNFVSAVEIYRKAYEENKNFENAVKLAHSLILSGTISEAKSVMETEYNKLDDKGQFRHVMAEFYQALGSNSLAIAVYETSLNQHPNDFILLNNLASLYLVEGQADEAVKAAEKAFKLAPNLLEIRDTLAQSYISAGQVDYGLKIIKIVLDNAPNNNAFLLTYAEGLAANGDKATVRAMLSRMDMTSKSLEERFVALRNSIN